MFENSINPEMARASAPAIFIIFESLAKGTSDTLA